MNYENFDWGVTSAEYIDLFTKENFIDKTYERFYKVKKDDIILDIGANYGSFSYSLTDAEPKHIYCLEPSNVIFNTLEKNLRNLPCTFLNKGISYANEVKIISNNDANYIYHHDGDSFDTITFESLMKDYSIDKVDLLKFDCEGGEAYIFTKENVELIKKSIRNIAGEYHITNTPNSVTKFIEFRDNYLLDLRGTDNLHVYERDGRDITEEIFDDNFLYAFEEWWAINNSYKGQFILYASFKCDELESIPVIGTTVIDNSFDVSSLLMSIDFPVDNFVIINNGGDKLKKELDDICSIKHYFIKNIKVVHMPLNIGLAGAWNLIIKSYIDLPFWIIANDNISFTPGLLEEMFSVLKNNKVGMVHPKAGNIGLGTWDLFGIHERTIIELGLFDENTYPMYCEDSDYAMRMINKDIKKVIGLKHTHIERETRIYSKTLEKISDMNIRYLNEKWGANWRLLKPNSTPFENTEKRVSYSTYDLKTARRKYN